MYYFYACQSLHLDVWWKRHLTTLQILQFCVDNLGNTIVWPMYRLYLERPCSGSWYGFWFGVLVIASFLLLFIQFYQRSYVGKTRAAKSA